MEGTLTALNEGTILAPASAEVKIEGLISSTHKGSSQLFLEAQDADPSICIQMSQIARALIVEVDVPEGYQGDSFSLYFALSSDEGFSEKQRIVFPLGEASCYKRLVLFPGGASMVRIDPTEAKACTGISQLRVASFAQAEVALDAFFSPFVAQAGNGIVILSHELSKTGAPLLAFNIAKTMNAMEQPVITLVCNDRYSGISEYYAAAGLPLYSLDCCTVACAGEIKDGRLAILSYLRERGYVTAILNTLLSTQFAPVFKQSGYRVISLVHETRESSLLQDFARHIPPTLNSSDYTVFPDEGVKEGILELCAETRSMILVRPQGVYFDAVKREPHEDSSFVGDQMGISAGAKVILGSGTANLRKGFDLFVSSAIALKELMPGSDLQFVWMGEPDCESGTYCRRLMLQVDHSIVSRCFHLHGFVLPEVYSEILDRCDVFWSTSRDDTFPSVVLEALDRRKAVVAFAGTGGVDTMLASNRGFLVEGFSVMNFALATQRILNHDFDVSKIVNAAHAWVQDELQFDKYVNWLLETSKSEIIVEESAGRPIASAVPCAFSDKSGSSHASSPEGGADERARDDARKKSWFRRLVGR